MPRIRFAFFLVPLMAMLSQVHASFVSVGSGTNHVAVIVDFSDGASFGFEVNFNMPTITGFQLFDLIETDTTLTTIRRDFGFGPFIDGITHDGHSDSGFGGGEDFWHYWIRESPTDPWGFSSVGAADRTVSNGGWDGWVYGSANPPSVIPEPGSFILVSFGLLWLARQRICTLFTGWPITGCR